MNHKIAFMFPGQGTQFIGMGKDFYEQFPVCKNVYDIASEVTGVDIASLCFEENELINKTEYTQVAILTTELAIYMKLLEDGEKPFVTAGLSLGEYAALVATGALGMEDAFRVVRKRGVIMQHEYQEGGCMAAIIGLDSAEVAAICEQTNRVLSIANYNCPGQTVISGEEGAVTAACEACMKLGALKAVPLKVSGPFHSLLLKGAGDKLAVELESVKLKEPVIPYVPNVTAKYETDSSHIKELLTRQVYSSVKWQQSVETMIQDGVDTYIEIGPGKTLSSFVRRIKRDTKQYRIQTVADYDRVMEKLK